MAGNETKAIAVLVSVISAAGFTFAVIMENSTGEFGKVVSRLGEPSVMALGFLLVPISLYFLYEIV